MIIDLEHSHASSSGVERLPDATQNRQPMHLRGTASTSVPPIGRWQRFTKIIMLFLDADWPDKSILACHKPLHLTPQAKPSACSSVCPPDALTGADTQALSSPHYFRVVYVFTPSLLSPAYQCTPRPKRQRECAV